MVVANYCRRRVLTILGADGIHNIDIMVQYEMMKWGDLPSEPHRLTGTSISRMPNTYLGTYLGSMKGGTRETSPDLAR